MINCTIILTAVTDLDPSDIESVQWFAGQKLIEGASGLIENLTDHRSAYYLVRLKNTSGCEIETRVNIKFDNSLPYFAPNVFSPNFDGINDVFKLYFDDKVYKVKSFRVFDRWGA
ncbi:MAG: gliding motility-associated C-terminal domain-containing protein [Candidatus Parvibacillus calidus]|nr:MAG: gliding motility-associated C-terminal domain-containing protein [Candidatus Parvibacillus calidus]